MDFIFDLIKLPFEIIGGSFECLTTCVVLVCLAICCGGMLVALSILNVI